MLFISVNIQALEKLNIGVIFCQMTVVGNGEGTLSRVSSQLSLQPVLEDQHSQIRTDHSSETSTPPTPHHDPSKLTISSGSYHRCVL